MKQPNTETYLTLDVFNTAGEKLHRMRTQAARAAVGLPLDLPVGPQSELVRHTILDVRQVDDANARVTVAPERAPLLRGPQLRVVIGPRPNVGSNLSILHGDRDLSPLLDVKSIALRVDANTRSTVVSVELLAGLDVFAECEFTREGVAAADLDALVHALADERTIMEVEPDNLEGLSRRHLVQLARSHRAFVQRARELLRPKPAVLCTRCQLPEEVHGHGETGREDSHPFEPPTLAIASEPATAPAGAPLKAIDPREPIVDALKAAGAREVVAAPDAEC